MKTDQNTDLMFKSVGILLSIIPMNKAVVPVPATILKFAVLVVLFKSQNSKVHS